MVTDQIKYISKIAQNRHTATFSTIDIEIMLTWFNRSINAKYEHLKHIKKAR